MDFSVLFRKIKGCMKSKISPYICVIITITLFFCVYYLCYPLPAWKCDLKNNIISKADYWSNQIGFFQALGTLAAVLVALFLEEIRSWFKNIKYDVKINEDDYQEKLNDNGSDYAEYYHCSLAIINNGNKNAEKCELYLESAFFVDKDSGDSKSLLLENSPIDWGGNSFNTYIPVKGKKVLGLFKITEPISHTNPSEENTTDIPARYHFLGYGHEVDAEKGVWTLWYCLNSQNTNPLYFDFVISWNGVWRRRQSDMKDKLSIKIDIK